MDEIPFPTAPGTIMRHMADGDRRVEVVLVNDQWLEVRTGKQARLVDDPKFQVLYDPTVSIA